MDIRLAMRLSVVGSVQVTNESHQWHPGDIIYWDTKKLREIYLKLHTLAWCKYQWISGRFPLTLPGLGLGFMHLRCCVFFLFQEGAGSNRLPLSLTVLVFIWNHIFLESNSFSWHFSSISSFNPGNSDEHWFWHVTYMVFCPVSGY